ncbi:hypothetical protein PGB90_002523 [Kerria lacca]
MSHRIIEKRRRDRMNNCLADLSRLIPTEYLKKGRGRIEKTEIIEMAIKHMKYLQTLTCNNVELCDVNENIHVGGGINDKKFINNSKMHSQSELPIPDQYKLGYKECLAETMRFLVELQGFFPTDTLCVKLINHLQKYYEKLSKGDKPVSNNTEYAVQQNNVESKINDFRSGFNEVEETMTNPVIAIVHGEQSFQETDNISTHLREMIVDQRINGLYSSPMRTDNTDNSPPNSLSPHNDNANDNHSSNGSLYKYKNYILERFVHASNDKPDIPSIDICSTKRQTDSTDTIHSSFSVAEHYRNSSRPVPIFALHSNGSYYVPLTVDSNLLSPFVTEPSCGYDVHGFSTLLLHPVTISVNFSRSTMMQQPSILPSDLAITPNTMFNSTADNCPGIRK